MATYATVAYDGGGQILPRLPYSDAAAISSTQRWPSSRRSTTTTSSHSSSPSLSSTSSFTYSHHSMSSDNDSPLSPSTLLRPPSTGIPFSWEQLPGIPKKQILNKSNSSIEIFTSLPLPPIPSAKFSYREVKKKCTGSSPASGDGFPLDPFLAALVECSKDEDSVWRSGKSSSYSRRKNSNNNTVSKRLAFNAYSCKRACAVSESMVILPRSKRH